MIINSRPPEVFIAFVTVGAQVSTTDHLTITGAWNGWYKLLESPNDRIVILEPSDAISTNWISEEALCP